MQLQHGDADWEEMLGSWEEPQKNLQHRPQTYSWTRSSSTSEHRSNITRMHEQQRNAFPLLGGGGISLFRHLMLSTGRCKVPRGIRGMTYVFHYGPFQPFLQNLWLHSLLESRIRPSWNWFISAPKLFIKYNWPSKLSEKRKRGKREPSSFTTEVSGFREDQGKDLEPGEREEGEG